MAVIVKFKFLLVLVARGRDTNRQSIHIIFMVEYYNYPRRARSALGVDTVYPRRARSALGVDTVLTLDVCLYVCMFVCMYVSALERKRLIGMT